MTALSVFAQDKAAYILSDAAMIEWTDKRVTALQSKVVQLPFIRAAVGFTGMAAVGHDLDLFGDLWSVQDLLDRLPDILAEIRDRNLIDGDPHGKGGHVTAFVAAYSVAGPRAYICSTGGKDLGGLPPYTTAQVGRSITPAVDLRKVFGRPIDPESKAFDPLKHGQRLIAAQRETREPEGHYSVGGWAELTKVYAGGVKQWRIMTWPDRIGEPIDPNREFTPEEAEHVEAEIAAMDAEAQE